MFDLITWIIENRNKPLTLTTLAAFLLLIVDKMGRKLITSQVKRLFKANSKHELAAYEERQIRIEEKLDVLMRKEGISWNAPMLPPNLRDSVPIRNGLSWKHSTVISLAHVVKQYINYWRFKMSNINKKILLPLLSAIALFLKQVFGYEVTDEWINMGADIVLYAIFFIGLFMKPKKDKTKPKENSYDTMDFTQQDTAL